MSPALSVLHPVTSQCPLPSQFLPQDKVTQFATMSPGQLLEATEQAIGDAELLRQHKQLIELKRTFNEEKQVVSH